MARAACWPCPSFLLCLVSAVTSRWGCWLACGSRSSTIVPAMSEAYCYLVVAITGAFDMGIELRCAVGSNVAAFRGRLPSADGQLGTHTGGTQDRGRTLRLADRPAAARALAAELLGESARDQSNAATRLPGPAHSL